VPYLTDPRREQPHMSKRLYVCHSYISRHIRSDILFVCTVHVFRIVRQENRYRLKIIGIIFNRLLIAVSRLRGYWRWVKDTVESATNVILELRQVDFLFADRGTPSLVWVDNFRNLMISQITAKLGSCSCRLCLNKEPLSPCTLVM
jgi:hypothetical protein